MKKTAYLLLWIFFFQTAVTQSVSTPDSIYGQLFEAVQMNHIFPDNKTFVDCVPKRNPTAIVKDYTSAKNHPGFNLKSFVAENFALPSTPQSDFVTKEKDITTHITNLWKVLKRSTDSAVQGSSLLPLPYPYIVPGGRFREIYYWDSYFTLLGLKESGEKETIENMVKNFAFLIRTYGHIPNGNRTYYLSRSQPPFFSLMLDVLSGIKGAPVYADYLDELKKEYGYWMDKTASTSHVVKMRDGSLLNRYYDQLNTPRQESYAIDVETVRAAAAGNNQMYRNLRSAAESGWDFSSRWFADGRNITTIQTTNLVPVDLNCFLYHLEKTLAAACEQTGKTGEAQQFEQYAAQRKEAINKYCWSVKYGWYADYNIATKRHSPELTIAGAVPFFLNVAPQQNIHMAAQNIRILFLKPGGVVTSLKRTGEQWDAPNGWAPMEWITITGMDNYQQKELARTIAERWVKLNVQVFEHTGKLMEKYNVMDTSLLAGGGEYPSQDGFGWTNGVLLALMKKYGLNR